MDQLSLTVESIVSDERFLAWYFKTDEKKADEWRNWVLAHPEHEDLVKQSIAYLKSIHVPEKEVPSAQVEQAYKRFTERYADTPVVALKPKKSRWWMAAAAAVLVLVTGAVLWSLYPAQKELTSTYGQLRQFQLPDGSKVMLNANSQLTLGNGWKDGEKREVWLKGEGFFQVQSSPSRSRFVVHTDNMDIIVTGTQFNVVNRNSQSSVYLAEGKVIVATPNGEQLAIKPGEFVKVNSKENQHLTKETVASDEILAWKENKLVFNNTSMREAVQIIQEHYGVKVNFADSSLKEKKLWGVLPNNNLDVLIESLEATLECKIIKTNNELLITNP